MPKGIYLHKKGYKRPPFSKEWKANIAKGSMGNTSHWKGDKAGYWARHRWLDKHIGRPKKCDHCGDTTKSRYEWANISGNYLRDPDDYLRLCKKCHVAFDKGKESIIGTFNDYNRYSSSAKLKRKMG
jgi:hypothetical protein